MQSQWWVTHCFLFVMMFCHCSPHTIITTFNALQSLCVQPHKPKAICVWLHYYCHVLLIMPKNPYRELQAGRILMQA